MAVTTFDCPGATFTLAREARAAVQAQDRGGYSATLAAALETGATVHEGLATLAARLRPSIPPKPSSWH